MINKAGVHSIEISIQSLPAHRFIGIRNLDASDYCDFWEKQEAIPNQDCHTITGLLESLKSINGQIGGWFREQGRRGYLYGIEVPADYEGSVPEGMECTLIPQSEYVVFHHPVYDFEKQDAEVWKAINTAMEAWNPAEHGFAYNDALPTYQRHAPERFGQAFCRPLLRIR